MEQVQAVLKGTVPPKIKHTNFALTCSVIY